MPSTLITSFGEYDAAIDRLLSNCHRRLDIFDFNLSALKLDRPQRVSELQRLLGDPQHQIRIVVQDSATVLSSNPRLARLLGGHLHHFSLIQAPDNLAELRDSLLIADDEHALIRFHRDQPRGKLIEKDALETRPYALRFIDILGEGGHPVSPRIAGL